MALGPSPTPDLLDPTGLFTLGEFTCFEQDDPSLLLFTHGEFPRAGVVQAGTQVRAGVQDGVGVGRRRRRIEPEIITPRKDEAAIALTLLLADDDDDWW